MAGTYGSEDYTDTWDEMRARTWDADTENLAVLLGLVGAGALPVKEQQRALRAWTATAPYVACPPTLKAKIHTFLATGANPDA
jgi:hypothetical protein